MIEEHGFEPEPGLPAPLPEGERVIWRGGPTWRGLALRVFHARKVAIYFALLATWTLLSMLQDGAGVDAAATQAGLQLLWGAVGVAILCGLAVAGARTSVYTLTNKRLLLRVGIALPVTTNLPLSAVAGVSMRAFADGTGDIPLSIAAPAKASRLMLWPHVRPWHWRAVEPMLRAVPNAAEVARAIGQAAAGDKAVAPPAPTRASQVAGGPLVPAAS
jgi:hypothetical protein